MRKQVIADHAVTDRRFHGGSFEIDQFESNDRGFR